MCAAEKAVDLEQRAQHCERYTLVESLQQLWVQMMNLSDDADAASSLAHLSHLTPLDEYTRTLGKNSLTPRNCNAIAANSSYNCSADASNVPRLVASPQDTRL